MTYQVQPELARNLLDDQVTEAAWQASIIELATKYCGWLCHHETDSRWSPEGFPDLILAHPEHGVIFLECKRQKRPRTTPAQRRWIWTLQQAGACAAIVQPSDRDWVDRIIRDGPARDAWGEVILPDHLRLESPL